MNRRKFMTLAGIGVAVSSVLPLTAKTKDRWVTVRYWKPTGELRTSALTYKPTKLIKTNGRWQLTLPEDANLDLAMSIFTGKEQPNGNILFESR